MKKPEKNPVYSGIIMKNLDCRICGMRFSVQDSFFDTVVLGGDLFYCPRGHTLEHVEGAAKKRERERVAREAKLEEERREKEAATGIKSFWYRLNHFEL
jgi:hypothetical protein